MNLVRETLTNPRKAALLGAATGAIKGVVVGAVVGKFLLFTAIGAVTGAAVGAGVSWLAKPQEPDLDNGIGEAVA
jgi:outer membrane lipoprotein SlyB